MLTMLHTKNFLIPKFVKFGVLTVKASLANLVPKNLTYKTHKVLNTQFYFSHTNPYYNQNFKIKLINLSNFLCFPLRSGVLITLWSKKVFPKELKVYQSRTLIPFFRSNFKMIFKVNPINVIKSHKIFSPKGSGVYRLILDQFDLKTFESINLESLLQFAQLRPHFNQISNMNPKNRSEVKISCYVGSGPQKLQPLTKYLRQTLIFI